MTRPGQRRPPGNAFSSLAAISLLFLIGFGLALRAQFYIVEDHFLLTGLDWGISDWLLRIRADIEGYQRVRPAYWVYIALAGRVFGASPISGTRPR